MFKNLDTKLTDIIEKLDQKFSGMFENFDKELANLKGELADSKSTIENVATKVADIETSLEFQYDKMNETDLNQKGGLEKAKIDFDDKIEELNKKLPTLEKQDRKYNLIFYGFPEDTHRSAKWRFIRFCLDEAALMVLIPELVPHHTDMSL